MNEKIKTWFKKVGGYFIAIFSGIIATIIGGAIIHNNRKSVARNRELKQREQENNRRTAETINGIESNSAKLNSNTERIREILQEVRKQKLD